MEGIKKVMMVMMIGIIAVSAQNCPNVDFLLLMDGTSYVR